MGSYYEGLPIFRLAMDCAARLDAAVKRFSRFHKYTIGTRIRDTSIEIVLLVARGNRRAERAVTLPMLCDRVEELKLLLNLGKELQAFASFTQFAENMEQVVALARQAEAWRKSTLPNERPEPGRRRAERDAP